jgi:hypothetical protein
MVVMLSLEGLRKSFLELILDMVSSACNSLHARLSSFMGKSVYSRDSPLCFHVTQETAQLPPCLVLVLLHFHQRQHCDLAHEAQTCKTDRLSTGPYHQPWLL